MMGRHPLGSLRRIDRKALHRTRAGAARPPRRQARSRAAGARPVASPTSRSSRSPRRCRFDARVLIMDEPTAALSGPRGRAPVRRRRARCRSAARRCCSSATGSTRSSRSATRSPSCATARSRTTGRPPSMTTDELVRRMVGRELAQLFPKQDAEIGEPVLAGRAAHARGRVHRRLLRGPARRDRRARRPRRRRPQRGRARDLRHRQARRAATSRSTACKLKPGSPRGRDARRHRPRARGPPPAGPRDGALHRAQHRPHAAAGAARQARRHRPRRRGQARLGLGDQAAAQVPPAERSRRLPVRRQPAEGRARQVAGHRARRC